MAISPESKYLRSYVLTIIILYKPYKIHYYWIHLLIHPISYSSQLGTRNRNNQILDHQTVFNFLSTKSISFFSLGARLQSYVSSFYETSVAAYGVFTYIVEIMIHLGMLKNFHTNHLIKTYTFYYYSENDSINKIKLFHQNC